MADDAAALRARAAAAAAAPAQSAPASAGAWSAGTAGERYLSDGLSPGQYRALPRLDQLLPLPANANAASAAGGGGGGGGSAAGSAAASAAASPKGGHLERLERQVRRGCCGCL